MGKDRPCRGPEGSAGLIELRQLTALDPGIALLARAAEREGHRFVQRLIEDWVSGANRFDQEGELFLGAFLGGRLVGIGGLNRDPYLVDPDIGRVRHLYVLPEIRRTGVGGVLLRRIIGYAGGRFRLLRLRTVTTQGAAFYATYGFTETNQPDASHQQELTGTF